VEVPKQRNTKDENKQIKNGEIPKSFEDNSNKKEQKDTDARWTQKNNVNYFGYKNHIKIDSKSKIITKYEVTSANVHDSQVIDNLLNEKDKSEEFYADSAYTGEKQVEVIDQKGMINCVHEKGYKGRPLTDEQKLSNTEKSRTRTRVVHIFGFMETNMNQMYLQYIGFKRINASIGLMNLTYNMFRKIQLQNI
jgi:IS5 family transposase